MMHSCSLFVTQFDVSVHVYRLKIPIGFFVLLNIDIFIMGK